MKIFERKIDLFIPICGFDDGVFYIEVKYSLISQGGIKINCSFLSDRCIKMMKKELAAKKI